MQLTLREMTGRFFNIRMIAIWLAASFATTLAGPFGTLDMPLVLRAVYWTISVGAAIAASNAIISLAYERLRFQPLVLRGMVGALAFAVIYAAALSVFGKLFFERGDEFPGFGLMLLYVAPIAVSITGVVQLFVDGNSEPSDAAPAPAAPRFLKRLKPSLGSDLVRLTMQDHYVEAVTTQGAQLVLMRFADALDELDGAEGWRIHRSHWVAEGAITDVKRDGGKTTLVMKDGAELPVSRTYLPVLREAGVLKRFA